MVQGSTTNAGSEYLTQGLVELIQGNDNLKEAAKEFLNKSENLTNLDLTKVEDVANLLSGNNGEKFLYQFPLHGKQIDNNGRKAIMK